MGKGSGKALGKTWGKIIGLDYKDVAQLNMYLSYYRKNMMQEDDNPPVGILLCTAVGKEMVEYATSGIDESVYIEIPIETAFQG